jgi:acetyl-CoA acetyltransferase
MAKGIKSWRTVLATVFGVCIVTLQVQADPLTLEDYLTGRMVNLGNPEEAATKISAFRATAGMPTTLNLTRNLTIDGTGKVDADGNPVVVLNLTDLTLARDVVLTLKSTTPGTKFVINVKRNFALNNARIALSGVSEKDVVYNFVGAGAPRLTGSSKLTGRMLSMVKLNVSGNAVVVGQPIGAGVNVAGNGSQTNNPLVSR